MHRPLLAIAQPEAKPAASDGDVRADDLSTESPASFVCGGGVVAATPATLDTPSVHDRDGHEQWLETLEPEHAAGAHHRHGAKSCQDLRKHSSTWHQQRRDHRDRSRRSATRSSFIVAAAVASIAGHGAFTAERHTLRSNRRLACWREIDDVEPCASGRVLAV